MCSNGIVQILIKDDVAAAMRPAAYVYGYADGGRMSCGVLDMYAHDGVLTAHTLRSKADCVDAVFQKFLHGSCALVLVVASQRTHQGFLGKQSCGLYGSCNTNTN